MISVAIMAHRKRAAWVPGLVDPYAYDYRQAYTVHHRHHNRTLSRKPL